MKPNVASPIWSWGVLLFSVAFIASSISLIVSANQQQDEIGTNVDLIMKLSGVEKSMRDLEKQFAGRDLTSAVDYTDARRRLLSSYRSHREASRSASQTSGRVPAHRIDSLVSEMDRLYAELLMSEYAFDALTNPNADFGLAVSTALDEVKERTNEAYGRLANLSIDVAAKWRTITALIVILSLLGIFAAVLHSMHHSADIYEKSEQYFKALFSNSSDVISIIGSDGSMKYVSPSSVRILGSDPASFTSSTMYEHVHPDDVTRVHGFVVEYLQKPGAIGLIEYRWRHASGEWVHLEATLNNQIDEKNIRGLVVSARDITERKRAQEALNVRHRAIEATRNGVFITERGASGNPIIYCNPAFETMTGYSRAEALGSETSLLFGEGSDPQAVGEIQKAFSENRECRVTTRAYRKSGESFWAELFIAPVHDDSGAVAHFVCVQNDITDRKLAEEERSKFVSLVESSSDFIGMATLDGQFFYVNDAGRAMVGAATMEDVVNRELYEYCVDETKDLLKDHAMGVVRGGGRWEGEGRLYNARTGKTIDVAINLFLVLHPVTQDPMCFATVQRDVTDREQAMTELIAAKNKAEEMSQLKTAFLANMSHEIRTPLTGILGFASVLSEIVPDEQSEFVSLIEKSGRRLLETLNSVLDLARIESDSLELRYGRLDVVLEVRETVDVLRPFADEKKLSLTADIPDAPVHAVLDRACFSRIIQHLVSNAIKFTSSGGVTVAVSERDEQIVVDVADTGIGISDDFLPYLFDEFKQESTGFARSHEGSGLGLAVTRKLIEYMGGTIQVQSEKGGGSVFRIALPKAPPADGRPRVLTNGHHATNQNALVVAKCLKTLRSIEELLKDRCTVRLAGSASEADQHLDATNIDVIIYDLDTCETNGESLLPAVEAMAVAKGIPVVGIASAGMQGDGFPGADFETFIGKPISRAQLLDAVDLVLS